MREARQHEPAQIANYHQYVFVNRVDVKQIVLHLSGDATERRNVAAEHAVAAHAPQCEGDFVAL